MCPRNLPHFQNNVAPPSSLIKTDNERERMRERQIYTRFYIVLLNQIPERNSLSLSLFLSSKELTAIKRDFQAAAVPSRRNTKRKREEGRNVTNNNILKRKEEKRGDWRGWEMAIKAIGY